MEHYNIIVACDPNGAIGINNTIPWKIKDDMKLFKNITSNTSNKHSKNVVVMGRKTWESIPEKFRPLSKRINIILSNTLQCDADFCNKYKNTFVFNDFEHILKFIKKNKLSMSINNVFFIGGVSIYNLALKQKPQYLHISHVKNRYIADIFLPIKNITRDYEVIFTKEYEQFTYKLYSRVG